MNNIAIKITQGTDHAYPPADINIVIDVIRAFTVSHIAFLLGVREIWLVNTVAEAWALKEINPEYLLAGEVGGLPIQDFELDNSPYTFSTADIAHKSLVQKTSNGVRATLLALNADLILVTGLSNAKRTALHAKNRASTKRNCVINIIASHASDDDDLACAEYIRDILQDSNTVKIQEIQSRILASRLAKKFFDPENLAFNAKDMDFCTQEVDCDFVMEVDQRFAVPRIIQRTVI